MVILKRQSGRTTMKLMRKNASAVISRRESWINEFLVDVKMRLQWDKFSALCMMISARTSRWILYGLKVYHFRNGHQALNGNVLPTLMWMNFVPDRKFFVLRSEFGIAGERNFFLNRWRFDSCRYRHNFPFRDVSPNSDWIASLWISIPPWIIRDNGIENS